MQRAVHMLAVCFTQHTPYTQAHVNIEGHNQPTLHGGEACGTGTCVRATHVVSVLAGARRQWRGGAGNVEVGVGEVEGD